MSTTKQKLDLIGLRKVLATLPQDAFVVCFYINIFYSFHSEWMNALAEILRERDIITVGLLTPNSAQFNLDATDFVAVVPSSAVKLLSRINVFVISEVDHGTRYPSESKVLGCVHGHYMHLPFTASIYSVGMLDGLMVPARVPPETRRALETTWAGFVSPRLTWRSDRPFHVIPVGYPRHAALLRVLNKASAPKDAIVYAPHGIVNACIADKDGCLAGQGVTIIKFLLENFPEYKLIFRPDPVDIDKPLIQDIASLFQNNPRFILDKHKDQVFSLSRGSALVTDLSAISQSFAYLTLRPAVYFQPWQKWEQPMRRWNGGFMASTYEALRDALTQALKNTQEESEIISKNRERLVMPIEGALETIADWIQDFYNERPRPDWVTIDRSEAVLESEEELVQKLGIFTTTGALPTAAATVAYFRNQESPLLIAYALHVGRIHTPTRMPGLDLFGIAGRLLGIKITCTSYGETPPEYIRNLYALAEEEYRQRGDQDGVALVTNLMKDFSSSLCMN